MPDEVPKSSQVSEVAKPRWPLSRIVLLALLAVAIGLLAMDWLRGRLPRDRAYARIAEVMPAEEDGKSKETAAPPKHLIGKDFEFWTPEKVHDLLHRVPDTTEESAAPNHIDAVVTETYRFPGAFKSYLLLVVYNKLAHVAAKAPRTTLTSIGRSG